MDRDRRSVVIAALERAFVEPVGSERPLRLEIVDREPERRLDRRRLEPARRRKPQAVEFEVAVMIGEALDGAGGGGDGPAETQRGDDRCELGFERRAERSHGLISTTGTDGMRPAANASRSITSRSVSNRTGTSNWNPAVTAAPARGAVVSLIRPLAASTVYAVAASSR